MWYTLRWPSKVFQIIKNAIELVWHQIKNPDISEMRVRQDAALYFPIFWTADTHFLDSALHLLSMCGVFLCAGSACSHITRWAGAVRLRPQRRRTPRPAPSPAHATRRTRRSTPPTPTPAWLRVGARASCLPVQQHVMTKKWKECDSKDFV